MEDKRAEQDDINQPIGSSYPDSFQDNPKTSGNDPQQVNSHDQGFSSSSYGQPQPTNINQPTISPSSKKSPNKKLLLIIGLILFLLCIVGGVVYMQTMKDEPAVNNAVPVSDTEDKPAITVAMKNTIFKVGTVTASVDHPESWNVEEVNEKVLNDAFDGGSYQDKHMKVISEKGNTLEVHDLSGASKGGDCGPDLTYKLAKRLETKTQNAFFAEYTITNIPNVDESEVKRSYPVLPKNTSLGFHYIVNTESDAGVAKFLALNENDSITTPCALPLLYSFYNGESPSMISIFISRPDEGEENGENVNISYSEIADDTEFISMLQSLELKGGN